MQEEERLWTELIEKYEDVDAPWRGDIVGRAYGNRGIFPAAFIGKPTWLRCEG